MNTFAKNNKIAQYKCRMLIYHLKGKLSKNIDI